MNGYSFALWYAGAGLQAVVGGVMLWRKLYRKFPVFLAFIASQLVRFVVLFAAFKMGDRHLYRQAFLSMEVVDAVLSFAAIYELFAITFRAYEGIRELGWLLLRWASVVLVAMALVVAFTQSGGDKDPFLEGLFALEMGISIVRGGLLFLLFVLHAGLGLRWGRHAFGIAVGFGMLTSIALASFAVRFHYGTDVNAELSLLNSVAYDCAVMVWLVSFLRPESQRAGRPRPPKWNIEDWNRTLLELLQR